MTKKPKHKEKINGEKAVSVPELVEYNSKTPVWKFDKFDRNHERWGKVSNHEELVDKLISVEGQTWQEVKQASGGKRNGSNSHFISVDDLIKEAQRRFEELKYHEAGYDEVFSLRLTGKHRLLGLLVSGVFHVLWNDEKHEICPSNKK